MSRSCRKANCKLYFLGELISDQVQALYGSEFFLTWILLQSCTEFPSDFGVYLKGDSQIADISQVLQKL